MDLIITQIDEFLDYFPVNSITKKMRSDLINSTSLDYETLTQQGIEPEEASDIILDRMASPEQMATMIPNAKNKSYFILWIIGTIVTAYCLSIVFKPDFLQIFLPTRMEFPDIIGKFILYFFSILIFYQLIHAFCRLLPQKYLNRSTVQSAIFLYIGTIMASLYFSVAVAFIWHTFNGFNPVELSSTLIGAFILTFYNIFFSSRIMVIIYAFINALFFVFDRHIYHLDKNPQPYELEKIYHSINASSVVEENDNYEATISLVEELIDYIQYN